MATTLILGGGFGGIVTAVELRKRLPSGHRIILIDRTGRFTFGAAKTWLALDMVKPVEIVNLTTNLRKLDIDVVLADITAIDADNRSVETTAGRYVGDYLVVALGADYHWSAVPGLAEASHTYYSLDGAAHLRQVLERFETGHLVHFIPRGPFKCPPAPYEGAFMVHDFLKKKGRNVRQSVVTIEGSPMATAGPEIGAYVRSELEKRGIAFQTQRRATRVDPVARAIHFEAGDPITYDLLITVPPHEAPAVLRSSGLLGPGGWIPSDPKHQTVAGKPGVYALGDNAVISLPGRFRPDAPLVLPKAGILAEGQGKAVAAHIAAQVKGGNPDWEFDGKGFCYIELGDLHAARGDGNFFDMPNPTMQRKGPDMQLFEDKKKWIADWLMRYGVA